MAPRTRSRSKDEPPASETDQSFSKADNLAVLHVIKGKERGGDGKQIGDINVHMSLAFVAGVKMPYFPYEVVSLKSDFELKIRERIQAFLTGPRVVATVPAFDSDAAAPSPNPHAAREAERMRKKFGADVSPPTVRERILSVGADQVNIMHFNGMLTLLCDLHEQMKNLDQQIHQLHIVTNVEDVRWDWLYHKRSGKFLSDFFGIGITARDLSFQAARAELARDIDTLYAVKASREKGAIHFYSQYAKKQMNPFPEMVKIDAEWRQLLAAGFEGGAKSLHAEDVDDISHELRTCAERAELIVFSGHFDNEGYVIEKEGGPHRFKADDLPGGVVFPRRPIVILGGCESASSGRSGMSWEREKRTTLAERFIERGAGACLVTSEKFRISHYAVILPALIRELLSGPKASIGRAVRAVRLELKARNDRFEKQGRERDEELEMAAFRMHILGDPTATIF